MIYCLSLGTGPARYARLLFTWSASSSHPSACLNHVRMLRVSAVLGQAPLNERVIQLFGLSLALVPLVGQASEQIRQVDSRIS
eukprot:834718-Pleurochrysis_carterae.AAC.1